MLTIALPIVLLHGTSASLHTWDGWTDALKGQRRVIRVDLPGFGLTGPMPDGNYCALASAANVNVSIVARQTTFVEINCFDVNGTAVDPTVVNVAVFR